MANDSGKLLVKGLDPDDVNDLARYAKTHHTNVTAMVRNLIHERAEAIRREQALELRRQVVRRVHDNPIGPRLDAETIQTGIDADRSQRGLDL